MNGMKWSLNLVVEAKEHRFRFYDGAAHLLRSVSPKKPQKYLYLSENVAFPKP